MLKATASWSFLVTMRFPRHQQRLQEATVPLFAKKPLQSIYLPVKNNYVCFPLCVSSLC